VNTGQEVHGMSLVRTQTIMLYLTIHFCTLSVLCYSFLYQLVNQMDEVQAKRWGKSSFWFRQLPFWLCSTGGLTYITGSLFMALSAGPRGEAMVAFYILVASMCIVGQITYHVLPGLLGPGMRI
jgi:hypothetical protein